MSYRIEDVLESVQEGAPAPRTSTADIIGRAKRIRARRRWAAVAGAGGAALVTAVAVVAGLTGPAPRASHVDAPADTSRAPVIRDFEQPEGLGFTAGGGRVGRWQIGPVGLATLGYQQIPVYRDGRTIEADGVKYPYPDARITLYRPGAYDIASFGVGPRSWVRVGPPVNVTIAGRPGIERRYTFELIDRDDLAAKRRTNPRIAPNDPSIKKKLFTRTAFAWKYDGPAWATFVPEADEEPLSREQSLAIVAALEPRPAQPARVPYTLGWLPEGLKVTAVDQSETDLVSRLIVDRRSPTREELQQDLDIYMGRGRLSIWRGQPKTSNAPTGGRDLKCTDSGGYCTLLIDGQHFAEFERSGGLSMDEIRRILRGLTFTDVADRDAWKPI
ncbi:hypothetical protein M1L60_24380 [Actinoplanes sp. TRM 88003]|uniref:Uncharacterized protein n=1 Tax=Paractinoplanes aksuensis TaxID=2939490 RepID=A0ABT1DSC7_9ACTN|nr:hypothetical protein [Actinoplanes aksuensis]MCO8273738.1 hypothetical protein [Actinoplanes aksuensis]